MGVGSCKVVHLPRFEDERGSLSFIQAHEHVPFLIRRVYYLYELSANSTRGGHAHKKLHQLIIPVSGSFNVDLDDGLQKRRVHLSRPWEGLYICPMIWRDLQNFSPASVCLVLASEEYDETDYFRNYEAYLKEIQRS